MAGYCQGTQLNQAAFVIFKCPAVNGPWNQLQSDSFETCYFFIHILQCTTAQCQVYTRVKLNLLLPFGTTTESSWIKFSDTLISFIQESWCQLKNLSLPFHLHCSSIWGLAFDWTTQLFHNPNAQGPCLCQVRCTMCRWRFASSMQSITDTCSGET